MSGRSFILGIAALLFSAGSYVYQRKQQRKALDRARDARAQDLQLTPSGAPIPVAFGRTRVEGILSYGTIGNNLPYAPTVKTFGSLTPSEGKKREYLLTQHTLSVGTIHKVTDVWVQRESVNGGELAPLVRAEWRNGGTASPLATRFTGGAYNSIAGTGSNERGVNSKFTGKAFLTSVFRHDRDDPKLVGVPRPIVFMEANLVTKVARTGTPGAYALRPRQCARVFQQRQRRIARIPAGQHVWAGPVRN